MYTIKQASRLTGVPTATLRSWERRYEVVRPQRNTSGYRVYDESAISAIASLRTLIEAGWAPGEAARAIRDGTIDDAPSGLALKASARLDGTSTSTSAADALADFLRAAARLDSLGLEDSLDRAFATGSFEFVVEHWLFPALTALGDGWAGGQIDVAGEHLASQAVRRRLSSAFDAAGRRARAPGVLVGLPPGSQHELGALAFAVAAKRSGLDVHYLGADLPTASWVAAVTARRVSAVVLAVVMAEDREPAAATAEALLSVDPTLVVAAGGAHSAALAPGVVDLPSSLGLAVEEIDDVLHHRVGQTAATS